MLKDQDNQIPEEIRESIRRFLKRELRVSLSNSDGSSKNQDASELFHEILLEIVEYRDAAKDLKSYSHGIAQRRVADYFRVVRATFTKLQERLRYYFRNVQGFALWRETNGEWRCGYASWLSLRKERASSQKIAGLRSTPDLLRIRPLPTGDLTLLNREDWIALVEGILKELDGIVGFNDFTRIASAVLQLSEPIEESINGGEDDGNGTTPTWQPVAPDPSPHDRLATQEMLQQLWSEICELLPRQRVAYLLNPTDGDLEVFIASGVALQRQVREALALSETQFRRLWDGLPLTTDDRAMALGLTDDDERFSLLRKYLPVEDLLIAALLSATRNQVIGLRDCARRRLCRRMIAFREGRGLRAASKKS
jgi:DNA-directed RNA polymerase specialized sigma24 family protein